MKETGSNFKKKLENQQFYSFTVSRYFLEEVLFERRRSCKSSRSQTYFREIFYCVFFYIFVLEDVFFEKDWKSEAVRAAGSNRNFLQKLFCRK